MPALDRQALARRIADAQGRAVSDALTTDVDTACELVKREIGDNAVPEAIVSAAVEKVAVELSDQRLAPSGIRNFADVDSVVAVRVARDPMVAARPLLAPFLPLATS